MNDAWFNPGLFGGILGAVFGCTAGLWGSLAVFLSARGQGRGIILAWGWSMFAVSLLCLVLAAIAYAAGQPYGIWYAFGLVGVLGSVIFPTRIIPVRRAYAESASRRMQAADLL